MKYLEIQIDELSQEYLQSSRENYPGPGWYFVYIHDQEGLAALVNVPVDYGQKPVVVWRGPEAEIKNHVVDTIPVNQAANNRTASQMPDSLLPDWKPAPIDTQQALCDVISRQMDLIEYLVESQGLHQLPETENPPGNPA